MEKSIQDWCDKVLDQKKIDDLKKRELEIAGFALSPQQESINEFYRIRGIKW